MSNKEELRYLELRNKFQQELTTIGEEMAKLDERRNYLMQLLDGEVLTEPNEPAEMDTEPNGEVPLDRNLLHPDGKTIIKQADQEAKDKLDKSIARYLRKNPGASRADILFAVGNGSVLSKDVENSLKRLKNRGEIFRQGNSRAATWFLTVE